MSLMQPKYLTNTLNSRSEFIICKFCFENEISKKHLERFHYVTTRTRTCLHFHAIFPRPLCDWKVQDSPSLSQTRKQESKQGSKPMDGNVKGQEIVGQEIVGVKDF